MPKDWPDDWEQRRIGVVVRENGLGELFKGRRTVLIESSVPPDAEVIGVHHDWNRRGFCVVFCHPTFDPVPDGGLIPFLDDQVRMVVTEMDPAPDFDCQDESAAI